MKTTNDFFTQILKDLKMQRAGEKNQAEALVLLQDRLDSVVMQTLVALTTPEQKTRLTEALRKNDRVEEMVSDISSEIPQFSEAVELALVAEYEAIRQSMQKQGK